MAEVQKIVTNVTYNELIGLMGQEKLEAGCSYRITDYQTVHGLWDWTTDNGEGGFIKDEHGNQLIIQGDVEPLIVLATGVDTLATHAYSEQFPEDKITYLPTLDKIAEMVMNGESVLFEFFDEDMETPISGFKGLITHREDPLKNIKTNFDFRNITYRLYSIEQPAWQAGTYPGESLVSYNGAIYVTWSGTSNEPGNSEDWEKVMNIPDNPYISFRERFETHITELPCNINDFQDRKMFEDYETNRYIQFAESLMFSYIIFGWGCYIMTFGQGCNNITFGQDCYNMTFGQSCYSMTFGQSCGVMTFGQNCYNMTFGQSCGGMTFGYDCNNITFGQGCGGIAFEQNCSDMTFEANIYSEITQQTINHKMINGVMYSIYYEEENSEYVQKIAKTDSFV